MWTAARAVARNFTGSANVKAALDNVKEEFTPFLQGKDKYKSQAAFDKWHERVANALVTSLQKYFSDKEKDKNKVSYGRAAKIIAIYLKTVYVLRFPESDTSKFIHPPIDRVLLTNIQKSGGIKFNPFPNWTELDKEGYKKVIQELKDLVGGEAFWKLEVYWEPIK